MAESDTLIQSLNTRLDTLTRDLAHANSESKTRKGRIAALTAANTALTAERDAHAATIATLTTERDGLVVASKAAPSELQLKVDELQGQIRTRTHRDRFNEVASAAGAKPEALADLWSLSGYKADSDTPDEAKITEAIGQAKTGRAYLFGDATQQGQAPPAGGKKAPLPTGLGADRGSPEKTGMRLRITKAQTRDYEFMRANQKAIAEAHKAGTFDLVE